MIIDHRPTARARLQTRLHSQCVVCGGEHPQGLRVAFRTDANGRVIAEFPCDRMYQGYDGYLHGGVIAALLDSAMTHCLFAHGRAALTGELNVRFLKPVAVSTPAIVSAWVVESFPPLFRMEADLRQNGKSMARATAKFMETRTTDVRMIGA